MAALLPSQLLHANVAEDETACPICFGTMLQPRALPGCAARHVFCAPCIGLWFQLCGSQRTCPIDRRAVSGCHSNPPHAVAAQLPGVVRAVEAERGRVAVVDGAGMVIDPGRA